MEPLRCLASGRVVLKEDFDVLLQNLLTREDCKLPPLCNGTSDSPTPLLSSLLVFERSHLDHFNFGKKTCFKRTAPIVCVKLFGFVIYCRTYYPVKIVSFPPPSAVTSLPFISSDDVRSPLWLYFTKFIVFCLIDTFTEPYALLTFFPDAVSVAKILSWCM
jgi:hypothetical protein